MRRVFRLSFVLVLVTSLGSGLEQVCAESGQSTRITQPTLHQRTGDKSYPYRAKCEYILKELDLEAGDVVVDIGAGDGWWSEKMAACVGKTGMIHAAEVAQKKVDTMKEKFADVPQIHPYLCETDGTGLPENSCDLALFSQSYHHLTPDGHVDYLKHLRSVVKPMGRVVIIEKYTDNGLATGSHGTRLSRLIRQAEEAGWVPLRIELMTGTYHYIAIFAQKELFPPEPEKKKKKSRTPKPEVNPKTSTDAHRSPE